LPSSSVEAPPKSEAPARPERGRAEALWGGPKVAFAAILAGAAALRLVGVAYAHPFALFSPDEQSIVPRAWHMVHGGGLDPHWFDYPTLLMYLLAPFQAWEGAPSYLSARLVVIALALGSVAAAWWLGSRAYRGPAGAIAAATVAVETTHVAYSRMAVTDVPLTLGVGVCLALLVTGRIELAGLAAGLATSFKYPGIFLLVPLVVAGWKQWPRLGASVALAAAAFFASSPFILVHRHQAWHEAFRVQRLARDGWLGFEHDHFALIAFVGRLWEGLGPALVVCAIGLVVALVRRTKADLILALFVLAYFIDLMTLQAHFDRYVLPLVPPLGALAGRMRSLAPVTLLLLVVPLTWSVRDAKELTRTDTRVIAERWVERHIAPGTHIAADASTPSFAGLKVLALSLPGPKRPFDENRSIERLQSQGVKDVVVTGAITDRVLAARSDYPRESRFYDQLRTRAKRIYYLRSGDGRAGPWVAVYRLPA
jgi:hypothetical protein